jgi:DNA-binding PadR family transcriptional regulator
MTPSLDDRARAALPLTPMAVHILLALVDRDRHGLGIAEHVEAFTDGRVMLGPGNLYGTVKKLLELDLIDDAHVSPNGESSDPRRRYYRITPLGKRAIEIEMQDLAAVLQVARGKRVIR